MAAIGHDCRTYCSEYRYIPVFSYTETQSQIPQIWHDYMGEPEAARAQRQQANNARVEKKRKEAEAKKLAAAAKKGKKRADATQQPQVAEDVFSVIDAQGAHTGIASTQPKRKRRRQHPADGNESEEDEDTPPCLHPDDPANFLKLGRAMRILLSREITDDQIEEADALLREYNQELVDVR
jgi:hypothetical protein